MADAPLPTFTTLRLTRLGDYAVEVALNRPRKSNAIDGAMWRELRACFEALAALDWLRVVLLTGGDSKNFCAGIDLAGFAIGPRAWHWRRPPVRRRSRRGAARAGHPQAHFVPAGCLRRHRGAAGSGRRCRPRRVLWRRHRPDHGVRRALGRRGLALQREGGGHRPVRRRRHARAAAEGDRLAEPRARAVPDRSISTPTRPQPAASSAALPPRLARPRRSRRAAHGCHRRPRPTWRRATARRRGARPRRSPRNLRSPSPARRPTCCTRATTAWRRPTATRRCGTPRGCSPTTWARPPPRGASGERRCFARLERRGAPSYSRRRGTSSWYFSGERPRRLATRRLRRRRRDARSSTRSWPTSRSSPSTAPR